MKGRDPVAVKTQLAELIRVTNDKARYDKQVKKLLSVKAILAWILKTCTDEFSSFSTQEIINCIQGEPEISLRAVHPNEPDAGASMLDGDDRITALYFTIQNTGSSARYTAYGFAPVHPYRSRIR